MRTSGPISRAFVAAFVLLAIAWGGACSVDPNSPEARRAAVQQVLSEQLRHEHAMLQILDGARATPDRAAAALRVYVVQHKAELDAIAAQRALLEREPAAVAQSMTALQEEFGRVLALRQRLGRAVPELMQRDDVREALATLDAL